MNHNKLVCSMVTGSLLLLISILLLCSTSFAVSQTEQFLDMPLEELVEMPYVVSSIRQKQDLPKSSVPVSIVTSEDIHYSGMTNIYEVLQFYAGIDMTQVDRNHYALGIRGFHEVYSDRTLTLINGRPADNPVFGGSQFLQIPILLEDIDRIEIVRGPGGAAWGANAFNGVINIITKKPQDCKGFLASTQWNEFGDNYQYLRIADQSGDFAWRVSAGYDKQESSSDALSGEHFNTDYPLTPGASFDSRDFRRSLTVDSDFSKQLSQDTELTFGIGHLHKQTGDYAFLSYFPQKDGFVESTRAYTKIATQFDIDTQGYLQWAGNFSNFKWPAATKIHAYENNIQAQLDFKPHEQHNMTVGSEATFTRLNQTILNSNDVILDGEPYDEQCLGLFFIDRWNPPGNLSFEGQIRTDWYSETQTDWAGRLTAFYALDEKEQHVLRISGAKAYRAPKASIRELEGNRFYNPAVMTYLAVLHENDRLKNEQIYSLEAGYTGIFDKHWILKANAYFQRYKDVIGYVQRNTAPMNLVQNYTADNIGGIRTHGVELELERKTETYSLAAWYTWNRFIADGDIPAGSDNTHHDIRAYPPARDKIGATGRIFFADNWTLNTNYKYSSHKLGRYGPYDEGADHEQFHRIDLTLTNHFKCGTTDGELMVGVGDLFNETEFATRAVGRFYYFHETPGRMFFARAQLKF